MEDPGGYRKALVVELRKEFDEVLGFPPDIIPSGETAVTFPDDPYVEPGTYCDWIVYFNVAVFYGRAAEGEALDRAEETIIKVQAAAHRAGGVYHSMSYRPINIGGVDYLTAVHPVVFNQEG